MKTLSLRASFATFALGALLACGGEPTPVPPKTAPLTSTPARRALAEPAAVVEGDVTQQSVNGIMTLVKRVPGAELVSIRLYIRGGVRNWSAANAGIEALALQTAASGGTTTLDKDTFSKKLTRMGGMLLATRGNDQSCLVASTLTPHLDETFALLAGVFLTPAMPASEMELQRQLMLSNLRHEEEDPDARLGLLAHRAIFKGHPYENRSDGTIDTVGKLTVDQLRAHLAKLRDRDRLLLVVVGDVDAAHVADLTKKHFADVPRGGYSESELPPVRFTASKVDVVSGDLPTQYIVGTFAAPGWRDPDFFIAMVAMQHLGFRVFEEVRTKRNLSYAPSAGLRWSSAVPLGRLYVTAVDPDATIKVMFDEAKKLKTTPLSEKELAAAKSTLLTDHFSGTEATDDQAFELARGQLNYGDWRFERKLPGLVKQVTAEQVQAFATKYIQHLQMQVLGKKPIDKALFGSL